jgi:hypothetical protein
MRRASVMDMNRLANARMEAFGREVCHTEASGKVESADQLVHRSALPEASLPTAPLPTRVVTGFGTRLIDMLVRQLHGRLETDAVASGYTAHITFKT